MFQLLDTLLQRIHAGRKAFENFGNVDHDSHPIVSVQLSWPLLDQHLSLVPHDLQATAATASPIPTRCPAAAGSTPPPSEILRVLLMPSCKSCSQENSSRTVVRQSPHSIASRRCPSASAHRQPHKCACVRIQAALPPA